MRSTRGDDDGITLGLEGDLEPAGASQQPGVEWLDRVGVDGAVLGSALQQGRHGMRNAGIGSGRDDTEAHALAFPDRIDRERAAARDGLVGDDQQIEQQLDPVFRQQAARQIPDELGLLSFDETQRHRLRVTEFDLGGKRARRAEGKTAELQPRRGRLRAPLDEVEGESLGLRVAAFLLQHLEPVDDRPGGADQVMANARAQEGREIERIKCDGYGHGGRLRWRIGGAVSGGVTQAHGIAAPVLIHRSRLICQDSTEKTSLKRPDQQRPPTVRTQDSTTTDDRLLDELTTVVSAAGAAILVTRSGSLDTRTKPDLTPVTACDHAAEAVILEGVARLLPGICILSEEGASGALPQHIPDSFVLVDPLDGTRELIAGRDEFTINVAIIAGGRPRLGIVAAPAQALLWRGIEGRGAERLRLSPGAP